MTVKNRIVAIRLSGKLERNPEYAKKLGISVINGKTDKLGEHVHNTERMIILTKEGDNYGTIW